MSRSDIVTEPSFAFRSKGVTKVYGAGDAAVHALRGVDLAVPEGELVVVLGPSGSGKSTMLNIMGGLDRATDGSVWFMDDELTAMDDTALTRFRRHHAFRYRTFLGIPLATAITVAVATNSDTALEW